MRASILLGLAIAACVAGASGACIEDANLVATVSGTEGVGANNSTTTGNTTTNGTGGAIGCTDASQCPPGIDTTCRQRTCDGVCGFLEAAQDTPCTENGGHVCFEGECVECNSNDQCIGEPCVQHVCGLKLPDGDPCMADNECMSAHCVDDVCCDLACDALCEACVATKTCGTDGTCANVVAGTDPDSDCMQTTQSCFGGMCTTGMIVFTTSATYNGNMGGLQGADQKCMMHAAMGCLPGTYMAWLSTGQDEPETRFNKSTIPYRRVDGALVANNWGDLTDTTISAALDKDEKGNTAPSSNIPSGCDPQLAYTGTNPNGTALAAAERCSDWTSTTADGTMGWFTQTNGAWSDYCTGTGGNTCSLAAAIYCFQQ